MVDQQTTSAEEMLEWLTETIRLEAGSDACFSNQKFSDHTVAKAIKQYVLDAERKKAYFEVQYGGQPNDRQNNNDDLPKQRKKSSA